MNEGRILIKNGYVLSMDKTIGDFPKADVLIEGKHILEVRPNIEVGEDCQVIDASNMIVMPGLIDTHRHVWEGVLRNISPDSLLPGYFTDILGVLAPAYRAEDVYASNLNGALDILNSGITTVLDWSHIQNTSEHTDEAIRALQEAGLRTVFAYGIPNTDFAYWWAMSNVEHPEDIRRLRKQYFSSEDQLITLALAPRGPEFTTMDVVKHDWKLAREVGARISVHIGFETYGQYPYPYPIKMLNDAGLLGPDTTYIHCCNFSDEEIKMVKETGGTVSIATAVEMTMGHGFPPLERMLAQGLRPSLSIDVVTNTCSDMFTQMRSSFQIGRMMQIDQMRRDGTWPTMPLMTARDIVEFATIEGARACALEHKTGSLTPGKEADILLLRTNLLNMFPINDPYGAVVISADISNVDTVLVAGKVMKRDGKLLNVDIDRILHLSEQSRDYIVAKSGFGTKKEPAIS